MSDIGSIIGNGIKTSFTTQIHGTACFGKYKIRTLLWCWCCVAAAADDDDDDDDDVADDYVQVYYP